jgi:hypothetical protein
MAVRFAAHDDVGRFVAGVETGDHQRRLFPGEQQQRAVAAADDDGGFAAGVDRDR